MRFKFAAVIKVAVAIGVGVLVLNGVGVLVLAGAGDGLHLLLEQPYVQFADLQIPPLQTSTFDPEHLVVPEFVHVRGVGVGVRGVAVGVRDFNGVGVGVFGGIGE